MKVKIVAAVLIVIVLCLAGIGVAKRRQNVYSNDLVFDNDFTNLVFQGFGTSSCWWSQAVSGEMANKIAAELYGADGLNLISYRYNIGAGSAENPNTAIPVGNRRAESFYYLNSTTGEYEYDFTRDANARAMLDAAIAAGATEVELFCNSPHYSMTKNGKASGDDEGLSNLSPDKYAEFVDYVLTIADFFVASGYPVSYISPINEPQWNWGKGSVSQEGCHYTPEEAVALYEMFAVEMQRRGVTYRLAGPENGAMSPDHYSYIDLFLRSEILSEYCDTICGHSYWLDGAREVKAYTGNYLSNTYPNVAFRMSEWCELPMKLDVYSIESGLHMANVIEEDLNLMNATAWQSWTAVNGDGVLNIKDGQLVRYKRYYAYRQFTAFIQPEAVKVNASNPSRAVKYTYIAYKNPDDSFVVVFINNTNSAIDEDVKVLGKCHSGTHGSSVYLTDDSNDCALRNDLRDGTSITLPAQSITTLVCEKR